MRHDFRFFTPALLLTHGRLDVDPVLEYITFHGQDAAGGPFAVDAEQPFFAGLPPGLLGKPPHAKLVNWNNRLYAVYKDQADDCFNFLAGITVIDKDHRFTARVGFYQLSVVDITHYGGVMTTSFETLDVTVFGIDSSSARVYISPAANEPIDQPFVVVEPPTPEAKEHLERMLRHEFAPAGVFAEQPLELPHEHGRESPGTSPKQ